MVDTSKITHLHKKKFHNVPSDVYLIQLVLCGSRRPFIGGSRVGDWEVETLVRGKGKSF